MEQTDRSIPGKFKNRWISWKKAPVGLFGMVALMAAVECFVSGHRPAFMTPHELDWERGGWAARRVAGKADVLVFGDSMLKFGLSPGLLGRRWGCAVHSLALLDGKPAASYFLFRRALEAGARPRAVLVDFQPECMWQTPESLLGNAHLPDLFSIAESWDLAWTCRDPLFFARAALARALPSVRCREGLRKGVLLALRGVENRLPVENARVRRNRAVNRGGLVQPKRPGYRGDVPERDAGVLFATPWVSRPEHTRYVVRFLRLARERGIPVYWVIPPNAPGVEAGRDRLGISRLYSEYARALLAKYPNLRVIDCRHSGYGHDLFVDPVHLDRDGTAALSLAVADVVQARWDAPGPARWATLPRYRPAPAPVALEDTGQSYDWVQRHPAAVRR